MSVQEEYTILALLCPTPANQTLTKLIESKRDRYEYSCTYMVKILTQWMIEYCVRVCSSILFRLFKQCLSILTCIYVAVSIPHIYSSCWIHLIELMNLGIHTHTHTQYQIWRFLKKGYTKRCSIVLKSNDVPLFLFIKIEPCCSFWQYEMKGLKLEFHILGRLRVWFPRSFPC